MEQSERPKLNICPNCPWLKANHGRRSPGGFYTKRNLRRLWNEVRSGKGMQSCHMTDPVHPDHVAAGTPLTAQPHECPGSVALAVRELLKLKAVRDRVESEQAVEVYLRENPGGLKRQGIFFWLMQRVSLVGVPVIGRDPLPWIDPQLVDDEELCGRL